MNIVQRQKTNTRRSKGSFAKSTAPKTRVMLAALPAIAGALLLSAFIYPQATLSAERLMTLVPERNRIARIEDRDGEYVLIQPTGETLTLLTPDALEPGVPPRFVKADYNFDGFVDFALGLPAGRMGVGYVVYLYNPSSHSFAPYQIPTGVLGKLNCPGFWNITMQMAKKAINSTCVLDTRRLHDTLRIEMDGTLRRIEQSPVPEKCTMAWPRESDALCETGGPRPGSSSDT